MRICALCIIVCCRKFSSISLHHLRFTRSLVEQRGLSPRKYLCSVLSFRSFSQVWGIYCMRDTNRWNEASFPFNNNNNKSNIHIHNYKTKMKLFPILFLCVVKNRMNLLFFRIKDNSRRRAIRRNVWVRLLLMLR